MSDKFKQAYLVTKNELFTGEPLYEEDPDPVFFSGCSEVYLTQVAHQPDVPIVLDTGCSFSITPFSDDVVGEIIAPDVQEMHGLKDACKVTGMGWVRWPITV